MPVCVCVRHNQIDSVQPGRSQMTLLFGRQWSGGAESGKWPVPISFLAVFCCIYCVWCPWCRITLPSLPRLSYDLTLSLNFGLFPLSLCKTQFHALLFRSATPEPNEIFSGLVECTVSCWDHFIPVSQAVAPNTNTACQHRLRAQPAGIAFFSPGSQTCNLQCNLMNIYWATILWRQG